MLWAAYPLARAQSAEPVDAKRVRAQSDDAHLNHLNPAHLNLTHAHPGHKQRAKLLAYYDSIFDSQANMLQIVCSSPGYHSRLKPGEIVHPVRESFYYAVALLQRDGAGDSTRAEQILKVILPLQQKYPPRNSYGVWPWYSEEPLDQMQSVDQNWADFCGAAIAQILVCHDSQLSRQMSRQLRESLRHAANAIMRRDVKPGYTNIAVLGGGVCAVAGEFLDVEVLLDYGRERLEDVVRHTQRHGHFNEYNSPPYGKVVIAECERILQLVADEQVRQAADSLRRTAWRIVAESYHPGTQQWAGPHSRSSRDRLRETMVDFLNERLGDTKIRVHSGLVADSPRGYAIVSPIACPQEFLPAFDNRVLKPHAIRRNFILPHGETPATVGTTWFAEDASLGTVSHSSFWTQRKPVIAYWRTEQDPAVVFRVRFLRDGKDFASMAIKSVQVNNRVLFSIHSLRDRGDWHRSLDRPVGGIFRASDLRIRCELRGKGSRVEALDDGRFALVAGQRQMVVIPADSRFQGNAVRWQCGLDSTFKAVFVDGVCYEGPEREFNFSRLLEISMAVGLSLQSTADSEVEPVRLPKPTLVEASAVERAKWNVSPPLEL